jgi:hypothetical protein
MIAPATDSLDAALETLYREFAAPVPRVIEGCPCCLSSRGTDILLTTPLRDLTAQMLWRYVSGVFLTLGNERDFRYFLPRIFDIAANDPGKLPDTEIILDRLPRANWQGWRRFEREANEDFVNAWFERALVRDLAYAADDWIGIETESLLCGAAHAGLSITPWLDRLQQPDVAPILADMKARFPKGMSVFWESMPEGFEALSAMLRA